MPSSSPQEIEDEANSVDSSSRYHIMLSNERANANTDILWRLQGALVLDIVLFSDSAFKTVHYSITSQTRSSISVSSASHRAQRHDPVRTWFTLKTARET